MPSERLERRIGQETVDGWRLEAVDDDRAVLKRPNFGSKLGHVLVFLLTAWFSMGVGNLAYAAYRYVYSSEYKVLSDQEPVDDEEALQTLRRRYARGEIGDREFDRRLDRLVSTETVEDVQHERGSTGRDGLRSRRERGRDETSGDGTTPERSSIRETITERF